jgi:hypothetical protein
MDHDDDEELTAEDRAALQMAADALNAAIAEDWDAARKTLRNLSDEHGGEGVGIALLGWCDVLISKTLGLRGSAVELLFMEKSTGAIGHARRVPREVSWAGQMLAARAANDRDTWDALLQSLPDSTIAASVYVSALLEVVALNLRIGGGHVVSAN